MNAISLLETATLLGIEKLGLVIEKIPPQLEQSGFQADQLKFLIQEKLHQLEIDVLPEEEAIANGLPYLHLNIDILDTSVGLYVFATRITLKQKVFLSQGPNLELYAPTWQMGGIGTVGIYKVEAVVENILQAVNKFCRDYLAGNLQLEPDYLPGMEIPEAPIQTRQVSNSGTGHEAMKSCLTHRV
jgi:hypothetical protein